MRLERNCLQRMLLAAILFLGTGSWLWAPDAGVPKGSATHEVRLNGHVFTLPVGFDIELAAGPPLVDRPITADVDEQGRLYVSDSSGSNEKVEEQLKKRPHRILRLEPGSNGKFERRTVFADHMMFPEGTMWFAGSLYVAAPPSIWKLTDTKGDGVADQRVEWFKGKTLTGCANDLHGPYLGPDGWIYWCKGAFAKQIYKHPVRQDFITRASHIFRCRPDGTGIEPVMTGGMDNPVHVVFTSSGERIFTTTFFQHPAGGRRDGLVHAVYGGIYGKDHDVIYEHPWTGPSLMPVLTHLGAAAPCGLVRYESRVFGPEYQDNLFACLFNMHKVTRHVLVPDGATFKTRDSDFLVSNNLDFHPTHVLEDADGSLLVLDTGGWYKLCCPTSQLHKPDVLGGIYRIRRKDAPRVDDPRGLRLDWARMSARELANVLDDARPAVRRRAVQAFAEKGASAINALDEARRSPEWRRNAIWAATRIDDINAREYVCNYILRDGDETVRLAAIHSASVWRDREALVELRRSLGGGPSPHIRRAAAEALGRIGDSAVIPSLMHAFGYTSDRVLEHSLTFALIEIGNAAELRKYLAPEWQRSLSARRATLTALDQIKDGGLTPEIVAQDLESPDPRLKETAWWIAGRHPDWGGALAGFFRQRLAAKDLSSADKDELIRRMGRFASAAPVQDMLAERLHDQAEAPATRWLVLRAMAESGLKKIPDSWLAALTSILAGDDQEQITEAVAAARALAGSKEPSKALAEPLLRVAKNEKLPVNVRLTALAAVPGGLTQVDPPLFAFLRSQLDSELPAATRSLSAEVLSHCHFSAEQLGELAKELKSVGPMEMDRLLEVFAPCQDEKVGQELVTALKASPVRSGLRVEQLKPRLAKFPAAVQQRAQELYAALEADNAQQKAKLEQLLTSAKNGDVRRGQAVFNGAKASCASCHAIGYLGGNIGPDLTHIGKIRSERDILESIVFPSASFVRSYEPMLVTTKDGKAHNGVIRKDAPDEIVLATGINQEVRIARKDIEDIQPSKVSIMPAGLDQQLSAQDLADLVAFLKACQ